MIYSASRRTDMPAFFPDLLAERVNRSRKLQAIVFWTKDIRNLIRHSGLSKAVERFPCVVQFTVTGLAGTVWEPGVPELERQLAELEKLAGRLPAGAVQWRFDPVIQRPGEDALVRFRRVRDLLEQAAGPVQGVTVSFPDPYRHAVTRVREAELEWPALPKEEKERLVAGMASSFGGTDADINADSGAAVRLCCEPELVRIAGTAPACCVDAALFSRLYGLELGELAKDPGQRAACGCVASTDIGRYDLACRHGCLYCYARGAGEPPVTPSPPLPAVPPRPES